MTRDVALRASAIFILLSFVFGALGLTAQGAAAGVLFLTSLASAAVTVLFGLVAPSQRPIPVRVRR